MITKVLGFPKKEDTEFISDEKALDYIKCLPKKNKTDFNKKFKAATKVAIDFLIKTLKFSPDLRLSIDQAIKHPVFDEIRDIEAENFEETVINYDFED